MKFRKKPVEVEAWLFDGSSRQHPKPRWLFDAIVSQKVYFEGKVMIISTLEGAMTASAGDYIIQGVHGEIYPCKPDIFELTYEEV